MPADSTRLSFLFMAAAASLACTDGRSPPSDAGVGGNDAGDAGEREVIRLRGAVYEAQGGPGTQPIRGAKVCILDHPEIACASTDSEGEYTMAFPAFASSTLFVMHFTAAGHLGSVRPATYESTPEQVSTSWPGGVPLYSDEWAKTMAMKAGFTYPAQGSGFIRLRLSGGLASEIISGVTASLSPASGTGPIYADPSNDPDPSLTATVASNLVLFGNVAPGPVTITVNAGNKTCNTPEKIIGAWPASRPDTLPVLVAAGAMTEDVYLWCR